MPQKKSSKMWQRRTRFFDDELRGKYDRGEEVFENQGGGRPRRRPGGFTFGGGGFHFKFG